MFTKPFEQLKKSDTDLAGGKGASLGEMTQAGIPVPEGFVVLSNAFERFIEETDLNVEIDSKLHKVNLDVIHTVDEASEKIQALILSTEISKDIKEEVKAEFKKLNTKYVAVRSSATAEDGLENAWAGQLDSFLNTTEEDLLEKLKKCWASLFTPRAIFYRFEKNLHKQKISVAVVIQKMVESEVSGIAFSVHPVTQDRNQLIIEAGYGLGEAIVSGSITPDGYVVEKEPRKILDRNINTQEKMLVRAKGGGNEWVNIPKEKGEQSVLTDEQIMELPDLILKIEKHYGLPQDIEWAHESGKFYITQSRPITTLGEVGEGKSGKNMKGKYNPDKYNRAFQVEGTPFIQSEIYADFHKKLDSLMIFFDNTWTIYMNKLSLIKTNREGLKFYKNKKSVSSFFEKFTQFKKSFLELINEIVIRGNLDKENLSEFLNLSSEFFNYYEWTEYFYTDKAYFDSSTNRTLKNNLKKLEEEKEAGRIFLNKLFFGETSSFNKVLSFLSKKFNISIETLNYYKKEELLSLFDGKKVDDQTIKDRKYCYVMKGNRKSLEIISGEKAHQKIKNFISNDKKPPSKISGIIANHGKVKGKVRVIIFSHNNFDSLLEIMSEMEKGDILVAETTSPELMMACKKAAAIVTNQGGMMSHAAIVSRELDIPCIVGVEKATKILKDGDLVEVDADNGVIKIIKKVD